MTALLKNRTTEAQSAKAVPQYLSVPIADNVHIYSGAMVATDAAGRAIPAGAVGTTVVVGRSEAEYDNTVTGHVAGAFEVRVRQGIFRFGNSAGADLIAEANRFSTVYAVDDSTVGFTDASGARKAAGQVVRVSADGVWVLIAAVH